MKTATLIKDNLRGFAGRAALYRLSEPLISGWREDAKGVDLVVVSACVVPAALGGDAETYIFAADEDGEITNWCELPGSMKHTLEHADALGHAGYEVRLAAA